MNAAVAVGSLSFTLIKIVLRHLSPLSLAAGRVAFSAMFFVTIVIAQPHRRQRIERGDRWRVLLCGLGGSAGFHILFSWGQARVSISVSAVVLGTMPAVVAVAEIVFMRHRVTWAQMVGLLLSLAGIVVISWGSGGSERSTLPGIIAVAAATVVWSAVTVATRSFAGRYDPWWVNTPGTVVGAGVMLIVVAPRLGQFSHLSVVSWVVIVWLGAAGSAFVYAALAGAMKTLSATTAASLATLVTPLSIIIGWIAISDRPGPNAAFGSVAVVAGVVLVSRQRIHGSYRTTVSAAASMHPDRVESG